MLIDWDTALLAPPERDVWLLDANTSSDAAGDYAARSGRSIDRDLLDRYRLAWSLADIASFVHLLKYTAEKTADTAWVWEALQSTMANLAAEPGGLR